MANEEKYRYSAEADAALDALYKTFGDNQSVEQRINILEEILGKSEFYATGGEVPDQAKLACLEYDWLASQGKIKLELA